MRLRSACGCGASSGAVRHGGLAVALMLGAVLFSGTVGGTDSSVATVGDANISAARMETQLKRVPLFQLDKMGDTPMAIKRRFLDELIAHELMVQAAEADDLDELPEVRDQIVRLLRSALLADLRREIDKGALVTDKDVQTYYDAHSDEYAAQKRIKLFRILVGTRDEAVAVLQMIKSDPEFEKDPNAVWGKIAREHSLDKSTKSRDGNLGLIHPDGATDHKEVSVDPALFNAALEVKNGQIVPEPIQEGQFWAVVQRRGSYETPTRRLESVEPAIRTELLKERMNSQGKELRERLREKYVTNNHPELIDIVDVTRDLAVETTERPGSIKRRGHAAAAKPGPHGPPGRLR